MRTNGDFLGLSWVPSVGWEFDRDNWDQWREVSITADENANANVSFTHEVWDHNADCPVHDVGPITIRAGAGVTTTPGNGGSGGSGGSGSDGGDSGSGGNGSTGSGVAGGSQDNLGGDGGSPAVRSLPTLWVSDVTVAEDEGLAVFTLTLSQQSETLVTVDYATADGSATAVSDYTPTGGTFEFRPGELERAIPVAIHDDDLVEGHETFIVWLSNARNATIADGVGVGTIRDDEYAAKVPEDWLRQFGSTAVTQAVGAIDERMRCVRDRQPGVAGSEDESQWQCAPHPVSTAFAIDTRMLARLTAAADGATPVPHHRALPLLADLSAAAPGGRSLLSASSQRQSELGLSVWGRGSYARFDGGGMLPLGGDVWTAALGVDIAFRQAVAGFALAHSESEGIASNQGVETDVTANLTGFYPYLRIGVNDRISVWGTAGVGAGTVRHSVSEMPPTRSGIAMIMAAAGGLAEVVAPTEEGGLSVTAKADGLLLEFAADSSAAIRSVLVSANRVRLALEGGYEFVLHNRQRVAPFLEVGGRLDGADTEAGTGLGLEVGGGLRYAHPVHHLTAEVYSRALLVHAADGFGNWSAAGTLRYDPRSGSARGPYLTVTSSHEPGVSASVADETGEVRWRLATELGYGVPTSKGTATGTPWAGLALFRGRPEYRIGYRLQYDNGLHLSLAATMRDGYPLHEPPSYLLTLLLSLR